MAANPTMILVFEVDVPAIVNRYVEAKAKVVPEETDKVKEENPISRIQKGRKKIQRRRKKYCLFQIRK